MSEIQKTKRVRSGEKPSDPKRFRWEAPASHFYPERGKLLLLSEFEEIHQPLKEGKLNG